MDCVGSFLLSQFLWAMTFGFYHVLFSFVAMFLLLKLWERLPFISSFLLTLFAHIVSVSFLMVVVKLGVIDVLQYQYVPDHPCVPHYNPWYACLALGLTYAVLQSCFLLVLSMHYTWLDRWRTLFIVVMSNLMSSIVVYKLLPAY